MTTTTATTDTRPMRLFRVRVARIADLTPSFRRFTFTGDDLHEYGDTGFDQRIKVVFPVEGGSLDTMPTEGEWYSQWREMPAEERHPFRTYTTRAVRHDVREVDVDMVAHDVSGPASLWIRDARVGDEVMLAAPTIHHGGANLGLDFVPPERTEQYLLVGDETAAPAIAVMLEQLPPSASGVVVLEVPDERDAPYLPAHPGFRVDVAGRGDGERHAHLLRAAAAHARELCPDGRGAEVEEIDVDTTLLWEVPRSAKGGAALKSAPLYAWVAGESAAVKQVRRDLVREVGVDRRAVAFMGYWRLGKSEATV